MKNHSFGFFWVRACGPGAGKRESEPATVHPFTLRISLSDQKEAGGLLSQQPFASLLRRQVTRDLRLLMKRRNEMK